MKIYNHRIDMNYWDKNDNRVWDVPVTKQAIKENSKKGKVYVDVTLSVKPEEKPQFFKTLKKSKLKNLRGSWEATTYSESIFETGRLIETPEGADPEIEARITYNLPFQNYTFKSQREYWYALWDSAEQLLCI